MNAILVDDEPKSRENLQLLLEDYCQVQVVGQAGNAEEALHLLATQTPDILFLDIQMPGLSGIELAHRIRSRNIPIVFVTAYDHYAMQAIKASALDYLLKPTKIASLQAAVQKAAEQKDRSLNQNVNHLDSLRQNLQQKQIEKLVLPWEQGFKLLDVNQIIRVFSDGSYVEIYTSEGRQVFSKNIGEIEDLLISAPFYRVHNRHLINLTQVASFSTKDGGHITLKDGTKVPVSRRRINGFKEAVQVYFS